jgi:hypothetical protein
VAPFASDYTDHELVAAVREVTLHVSPRKPQEVSLRDFDVARAVAGHPSAPRASQTCERLDMSWPELKELAHGPDREVERTLAARGRAEELPEDWTEEDSFRCLRAIAERQGVGSVDPATYDRGRAAILAEHRGRWRHGREIVFPTANQIEHLFGSFTAGVVAAGLQPPESGSEAARRLRGTSMLVVDALELHLQTYGSLVPIRELKAFARAYGFQIEGDSGAWKVPALLAELRRRRDARGLWTPSGYPPATPRPHYGEEGTPEPVIPDGIAGTSRWTWTDEELEDALVRMMDEFPGEKITQRSYRTLRGGRAEYPNASAFNNGGRPGLKVYRARAEKRRRARRRRPG